MQQIVCITNAVVFDCIRCTAMFHTTPIWNMMSWKCHLWIGILGVLIMTCNNKAAPSALRAIHTLCLRDHCIQESKGTLRIQQVYRGIVWLVCLPYHWKCCDISRAIVAHFHWLRMMTSSNGNIFRITGHLCDEFTGNRWIPLTKASDAELWCFHSSAPV